MKRLDADTVFSIFENAYTKEEDTFDPFTHPYVLMGLIINGVTTFDIIAKNYKEQYPDTFNKIEDKVKLLYYDRLYGFIQKIDPTLSLHLMECNKHDIRKVVSSLSRLIEEYERKEEYTRCYKIKLLLDKIVAF